ncbi:protein KRI1 [Trichonephila clavipes]|uniref:Protein KRI1 n=1 Tax=Trichonephila clavipes TaxID=2585209 RepID=A0A8X6V9V9_TRICX|nr:protein KRI1 [Trichonephila clavipes]
MKLRDIPEDNGDDLFKVRTKTDAEKEKEEEDYKKWLETEKDMLYLNRYWNDPKLDEGEKFLKDYILNKRYIGDDQEDCIPTYNEITGDFDNLSEDEESIARQELFEHKYDGKTSAGAGIRTRDLRKFSPTLCQLGYRDL